MQQTSEALYFRDINRFKMLGEQEERALVLRVQRNEPGVADELVTANLRFVVSVARTYRGRGVAYLDLINEGNIGLIKAAKRFNLAMEVKFISYAVWWIRQAMQKALLEQAGLVKIPVTKVALVRDFNRAMDHNAGDYYGTMMREEFRPHEGDIVEAMSKFKALSFDTPLNSSPRGTDDGSDGTKTLADVLGEDPNQEADSDQRELGVTIDRLLSGVPRREERILRMYFGLNATRHFTLEEIAVELNLTRERVRLLRDKALRHLLRNPLSRSLLSPFFDTQRAHNILP
jgi:RNA polymerase primary sigma factor